MAYRVDSSLLFVLKYLAPLLAIRRSTSLSTQWTPNPPPPKSREVLEKKQ